LSLLNDTVEYNVFSFPVDHSLCGISGVLQGPVGSGKYFPAKTTIDQHTQRKVFVPESIRESDQGIRLLIPKMNGIRFRKRNPCFIHNDFSIMSTGFVCYSFELCSPDVSVEFS